MASVDVNLTEELRQFVDDQVEIGQFDVADMYVEALIARAKKGKERLEDLLIEGLDSGDPIPLDADAWRRMRGDVEQRLSNGA